MDCGRRDAAAVAVRMDVGDWTSVRQGADEVLARRGVPAFLACNAGIEHTGLAWEAEPADWERVQRVNVLGAYYLMRAFVPAMMQQGRRARSCSPHHSVGSASARRSPRIWSASTLFGCSARRCALTFGRSVARWTSRCLLPGAVQTRIFQDALTTGGESADEYRRTLAAYLAMTASPRKRSRPSHSLLSIRGAPGSTRIRRRPASTWRLHTSELLGGLESTESG